MAGNPTSCEDAPDYTLRKKIILFTTVGLLVGVSVFSFLGIRAVNQAAETMLQDRLTTAHLMAGYIDEALERALTELKITAQLIESGGVHGNFEAEIKALENTYSNLSIHIHATYLIDNQGSIIRSMQ